MDLAERVARLEDLHEIGQLRARYCQLLDDGHWDELAELFTEDGAFVGLSTARGRDELRTFFPTLQEGSLEAWWHFSSNETIDLDGDEATGQTWLDQPCVVDGVAHIAAGRYADRMRRCDDGRWRFVERKVTFFFWSPLATGWASGRFDHEAARAAADPRTLERRADH
ncbi:nuclear transport factor 2 family protein [Nocardioides sp. JQ2195]|nr:nuclear transport factor 2 family protein [Nocardioides sp. JQ2195]